MSAYPRRLILLGLAAGFAAGGLAACFSERGATAPVEGECRLPLGENIPGSTIVVIRGFAVSRWQITYDDGRQQRTIPANTITVEVP
jgi:hypothetical protein